MYSASKDGHIGVWRVRKATSSKFRPVSSAKHPLSSLALLPEEVAGNGVLVGAEAQVMWVDMDARTVVRTFDGHSGAVAAIEVFSLPSVAKSAFFLSTGSSEKDRMINVWRLEAKGKTKKEEAEMKPEAFLNASEALESLTVTASNDGDEEVALVGCVSKTGVFRLFDFDPNSKKKGKAGRPKVTVQVKTRHGSKFVCAVFTNCYVPYVRFRPARTKVGKSQWSPFALAACPRMAWSTWPTEPTAGCPLRHSRQRSWTRPLASSGKQILQHRKRTWESNLW